MYQFVKKFKNEIDSFLIFKCPINDAVQASVNQNIHIYYKRWFCKIFWTAYNSKVFNPRDFMGVCKYCIVSLKETESDTFIDTIENSFFKNDTLLYNYAVQILKGEEAKFKTLFSHRKIEKCVGIREYEKMIILSNHRLGKLINYPNIDDYDRFDYSLDYLCLDVYKGLWTIFDNFFSSEEKARTILFNLCKIFATPTLKIFKGENMLNSEEKKVLGELAQDMKEIFRASDDLFYACHRGGRSPKKNYFYNQFKMFFKELFEVRSNATYNFFYLFEDLCKKYFQEFHGYRELYTVLVKKMWGLFQKNYHHADIIVKNCEAFLGYFYLFRKYEIFF